MKHHVFNLSFIFYMYLKHSVHFLMELFNAVPKLPDIVMFAFFLQIYIYLILKNTSIKHFLKGVMF